MCISVRCVDACVRSAADLGYLVTVVRDCCGAQTRARHAAALRVLRKEISSMDHKYNVARGSPPLSSPTAPRIDDLQRKKLEASVGSSFHRSPIFDSPDSPPRLDALEDPREFGRG